MREVQEAKVQLVSVAHRAYSLRLQTGDGGNLSIRVPSQRLIVIKQSRCSFADCSVENLVSVNFEGQIIDGDAKPSSELDTHLAIYEERPDIQAIFHCHSPWAIAFSNQNSEVPPLTYHVEAKLGQIPIIEAPPAMTHKVVRPLLKKHPTLKAFVQRSHGIFAFDTSIERAFYHAELVEETSQIAYLIANKLN